MISDWTPLFLTIKLGLITTGVLFIVCLPLTWWLAGSKQFIRIPLKALITLPLVLPPTVLGFYLLIMFGPAYPVDFSNRSFICGCFFLFTGSL